MWCVGASGAAGRAEWPELIGPGTYGMEPVSLRVATGWHAHRGLHRDNPGGPTVEWARQIGSTTGDDCQAVAVDSGGNICIAGTTFGSLAAPNAGSADAFVAKYDASGTILWARQIGTESGDHCQGVATDSAGNVYISGYTYGSLGGPNMGSSDAFLLKYDASGGLLWKVQLGTSESDLVLDVAVAASDNAYMCGYTTGSLGGPNAGKNDAFVAKYDDSGNLLWTAQLGTVEDDTGWGVAVDGSGNTYITGYTYGNVGGPNAGGGDAYVAKYNPSGSLQWAAQLGTGGDELGSDVAVDGSGNAYISGWTPGSLGGQGNDAFIAKYSTSGSLLWTTQLGTGDDDGARGVAVDGSGNAYIGGYTTGSLGGPSAGLTDAFLAKYDPLGGLLWKTQVGTPQHEGARGVAVNGSGNAYIAGYTYGNLGGPNLGDSDAFLVKFTESCYADCDQSGGLDLFDFLCFLNAFNASDPYADCDNSGGLDLFDFLCFTNAFNNGCP